MVADDHRAIVAAAREVGADRIVVGLPRSLSGALGPAARAALDEIEALAAAARAEAIEVDTYDERFTTMIAQRDLRDANPRRKQRQRAQREQVDAVAAAVILQSWLDARLPGPRGESRRRRGASAVAPAAARPRAAYPSVGVPSDRIGHRFGGWWAIR